MDSQGAGFAFDMNMDFSNVFPLKPSEGNTSSNFFFGDEGVETATSFGSDFDMMNPALLTTTPQEQTYMPQSLAMDNTSGSTSTWLGQLTPQSHNALNSFPATPVQSFDALLEQPVSLGKRALQLDVDDFPQAKRHEAIDCSTMFSPASSWTQPAATLGLSDEAADMCAMWFNKYAILPSDRHINSLSELTGEPADAIRHWFGRLLKQGMGSSQGDSAYKSQTALVQQDQFWNNISTDIMSMPQSTSTQSSQDALNICNIPITNEPTTTVQPANALRSGKKQRCSPTDDVSLLSRDPNKIYQCTRKCGKRYGRKCDWKRNEEEGYPCKSWVCSLCTSHGAEKVKACFRKYHFAQHFRNIHPGLNCDDYEETSLVSSETEFPRQCGFCKHRFESRQERIDHIAEHFKQGKCMLDWNEDGGDGGSDSDNNDDGDDGPSGDGFDSGSSSFQPPGNDDYNKYFGGSDDSGSGGDSDSGGGLFQFQLSPFAQGQSESLCDKLHIRPIDDPQRYGKALRASSEPAQQCSADYFDQPQRDPGRPEPNPTTKHNKTSLAGDVFSKPLTDISRAGTQCTVTEYAATNRSGGLGNCNGSALTVPSNALLAGENATLKHISDVTALRAVNVARDLILPTSLSSSTKRGQQGAPINSSSFLSVKLLGSGGFSTVDEVIHRETNLRLGRKTLKSRDPAAIKEVLKEVNVLQKLRHPHVIRFLGAYSRGDKMSILLAPVADTTLALWLDRYSQDQPANLAETVTKMFGCLASSVRYLHEQRPVIKHLDIKPQNVLVVEGDREFPHVVLCDFGISSSAEPAEEELQPLTRHYVAPEVFEGLVRKQSADIWSLGCVMTEMASVAFSQDNDAWSTLRETYNGRTGKHYWQDVSGLQDWLATLLDDATTPAESTAVRSIMSMLDPAPDQRPHAKDLTLVFAPASCCLSWPNENATYPGPREELLSSEGLLQEDVSCCSDGRDQHDLSNKPLIESFAHAKDWVEQCSHSHEACRQPDLIGSRTLPTRLVDIRPDPEDDSFVRVVSSGLIDDTSSTNYIALSHLWTNSHVQLTSDSLEAMEAHLPKQLLSQALNTAIATARGLDYKYIWVDSLCVLQDSDDDKHHECTNMASTFRNAAMTIVLDNIDESLVSTSHDSTLHSRIAATAALPPTAFTTPGFAWDTRAWSLQERLLSRRFLHLGPEQMYWECNSLKASDTFPQGMSSLIWEKVHSKTELHDHHIRDTTRGHGTMKRDMPTLIANANDQDPRRLRNCQWIKKQGDAIGDSMQAATMAIKQGGTTSRDDTLCQKTIDGCTRHVLPVAKHTQADGKRDHDRLAHGASNSPTTTKSVRNQHTLRRDSPTASGIFLGHRAGRSTPTLSTAAPSLRGSSLTRSHSCHDRPVSSHPEHVLDKPLDVRNATPTAKEQSTVPTIAIATAHVPRPNSSARADARDNDNVDPIDLDTKAAALPTATAIVTVQSPSTTSTSMTTGRALD